MEIKKDDLTGTTVIELISEHLRDGKKFAARKYSCS